MANRTRKYTEEAKKLWFRFEPEELKILKDASEKSLAPVSQIVRNGALRYANTILNPRMVVQHE